MNETVFKNRWIKYVHKNKRPSYFFKFHSNIHTQFKPDIIGSAAGKGYAVEHKVIDLPKRDNTIINPTKLVTVGQRTELERMEKGGWECWIAILIRPTNDIIYVPWWFKDTFRKDEFHPMAFQIPNDWFPTNF